MCRLVRQSGLVKSIFNFLLVVISQFKVVMISDSLSVAESENNWSENSRWFYYKFFTHLGLQFYFDADVTTLKQWALFWRSKKFKEMAFLVVDRNVWARTISTYIENDCWPFGNNLNAPGSNLLRISKVNFNLYRFISWPEETGLHIQMDSLFLEWNCLACFSRHPGQPISHAIYRQL